MAVVTCTCELYAIGRVRAAGRAIQRLACCISYTFMHPSVELIGFLSSLCSRAPLYHACAVHMATGEIIPARRELQCAFEKCARGLEALQYGQAAGAGHAVWCRSRRYHQ